MIKDKNIEISKKDYLAFKYFAVLYDLPGLTTVVWVFSVSLAVLIDYFYTQRSFIILLIALLMSGMYINNLFFKTPKVAKEEYESKTFPNPKYLFSFSNDSVTITREGSSPSEIKLATLSSSYETFLHFCFFISLHNYIIVPKRLLSDDEIMFIRKAIRALPLKKRKNPFSSGVKNTIKTFLMLAFITVCAVLVIFSHKMTS